MTIRIYHNQSSERTGDFISGYRAGDVLKLILELKQLPPSFSGMRPESQLDVIFQAGNHSTIGPITSAYHAQGVRSLSVGDVVQLDQGDLYACMSSGWESIDISFWNYPYCARCLGEGCERCGQTGREDDLNPAWTEA